MSATGQADLERQLELFAGTSSKIRTREKPALGQIALQRQVRTPHNPSRGGDARGGTDQRVRLVNERDELTHRVTEVRVFGSYLSDKASGTILGARKSPSA